MISMPSVALPDRARGLLRLAWYFELSRFTVLDRVRNLCDGSDGASGCWRRRPPIPEPWLGVSATAVQAGQLTACEQDLYGVRHGQGTETQFPECRRWCWTGSTSFPQML